jgi:hemolysin activation/secretion protein
VQLTAEVSYLWEQAQQWRFLTSARYVHTKNLPADKQLTLGGDSGLRGYPTRYQPGDRSALLTLEQRYYSNAYPFGLLRVGYAAFFDVGRAWFHDAAPQWLPPRDGDHFGTLSNVGLGLRLESIRTRRDRVLHLDIAKSLQDGPEVENWEITLSGKTRF